MEIDATLKEILKYVGNEIEPDTISIKPSLRWGFEKDELATLIYEELITPDLSY